MSGIRRPAWRIYAIVIFILLATSILSPAPAKSALASTQLLQDPSFESGDWLPFNGSPWTPYGSPELIDTLPAHTGAWSLQFGDLFFGILVDDLVTQSATIPANAGIITLSYWYTLLTNEVSPNADFVCVGLYGVNGSPTYAKSCVDIGDTGNVPWTQATYTLPLPAALLVRGQNVQYGLSFTTDFSLTSQARVDDVALEWDIRTDWPTYLPTVNVRP
jgi:hypothetical protein